jgi:hypothetical protein
MSATDVIKALELYIQELLAGFAGVTPANVTRLEQAITDLWELVPEETKGRHEMTAPLVSIAQSDLDAFATSLEAVKTALAGYIATLQANQSAPLSAADESGLAQAVSDLQALQPPAPTT